MSNLTALDTVLSTTPAGAELQQQDFNALEERLKALFDDRKALDTLPERCVIERELKRAGLGELVDDLRERKVKVDAVSNELRLAWWTTVFDDIVHSSAIISSRDGSALQAASDRFVQVDVEHVRSIGPMIMQESMRRLCDLLFSRTQEANMMHTALAGTSSISLSRIHQDYPEILAAAKPVIMATPATLAAVTNPTPIADVVIIDAAAHLPSVLLLSILCRARQVVILAHRSTVTSEGIGMLMSMLPNISVASHPTRRDPRVNRFLEEQGYGKVNTDVVREPMQGHIRFHKIEAAGVPLMASGLVESSQQEIAEVVRLITQRAQTFTLVPPSYLLTVVCLTSTFRTRLGAELRSHGGEERGDGPIPAPCTHRRHRRCGRRPCHRRDPVDELCQDHPWAAAPAVWRAREQRRPWHAARCTRIVRSPSRYCQCLRSQ